MSPETPKFGFLNVNKPPGPTSHDIVAGVRRGTKVRKVGHAGTLDPMASGVLIVCLGPATRLSSYAMNSPKQYRARIKLGVTTDTYDAEGQITAEQPIGDLTCDQAAAMLPFFVGEIEQIPPMYSAIKQDGKKLYELARAGQEVEREPRQVTITSLELLSCDLPEVEVLVHCSPGTYIRSLAYDLGAMLGVGAHLTGLVRVTSGAFHVDDAIGWDDLQQAIAADDWAQYLLPPDQVLVELPVVHLTAEQVARVQHGNAIPAEGAVEGEARAYDPDGRLLALVKAVGPEWQPVRVFQSS
ncbi:tRNA pseudouridine(55) synthase TruB [Chloroflexota bacterium]